jgi:hypothetical protein
MNSNELVKDNDEKWEENEMYVCYDILMEDWIVGYSTKTKGEFKRAGYQPTETYVCKKYKKVEKMNSSDLVKDNIEIQVEPRTNLELLELEYPTIYNGYKQIMNEQFELFASKHLDYGMQNISQGTQLSTIEEKEFSNFGLFFRINDKIQRWKNLIMSGRETSNESLIDTYQDITNYGIIAQLVERGMWKK